MAMRDGMTCTRCFGPALDLDPRGMSAATIGRLCETWMCPECLDEVEAEAADDDAAARASVSGEQ